MKQNYRLAGASKLLLAPLLAALLSACDALL